jgi:hypothetical protein
MDFSNLVVVELKLIAMWSYSLRSHATQSTRILPDSPYTIRGQRSVLSVPRIPVLGTWMRGMDLSGEGILDRDMALSYHLYPPTVAFEYAFPVRTTSS